MLEKATNSTSYVIKKLTPENCFYNLFILLHLFAKSITANNVTNTADTTNNSTKPNEENNLQLEIYIPYVGILLLIGLALLTTRIVVGHGLGPAKRSPSSRASNSSIEVVSEKPSTSKSLKEESPYDSSSSVVEEPSTETSSTTPSLT